MSLSSCASSTRDHALRGYQSIQPLPLEELVSLNQKPQDRIVFEI